MKYIELQAAFETEIAKIDDNLTKPNTTDIEHWLNAGLEKFVKTRYSGINYKQAGFEQNQKRIDDLRTLVTKYTKVFTVYPEEQIVKLPSNYMFTLGETAEIASNNKCWPKDSSGKPKTKPTDVLEATIENFDRQRNNSLSEYRFHGNNARPLRLYEGDEIHLFNDGEYYVKQYTLTYLREPQKISLTASPFEEYSDMPAATHLEIVKIAAELYLENQANPRYQSYVQEVSTME